MGLLLGYTLPRISMSTTIYFLLIEYIFYISYCRALLVRMRVHMRDVKLPHTKSCVLYCISSAYHGCYILESTLCS